MGLQATGGSTFLCWDEENEDEEDAEEVLGRSPVLAAEWYAKTRWGYVDNAEQQRICVEGPDGKVSRFVVRVEMVPEFTARPVEESDG